jgi:hypothetical protein
MFKTVLAGILIGLALSPAGAQYLGNLSKNPYAPNSTGNRFGAGNPSAPNSVTNPYGQYGSPYAPNSAKNPYTFNSPKLYDSQGNYRGNLSANTYDPDSTSNPNGQYGSRYAPQSPNNPYGQGLRIQGSH